MIYVHNHKSSLIPHSKNVVYNYTDAETKVREATSNDPWGPSSAVMAELADYTYHVYVIHLQCRMLARTQSGFYLGREVRILPPPSVGHTCT